MKFSEFRKGGKKLVLTAAVLIAVVAGALVVTTLDRVLAAVPILW